LARRLGRFLGVTDVIETERRHDGRLSELEAAVAALRSNLVEAGGFTRWLLERVCIGHGIEIGPGSRPYAPSGRCVFVDRFPERHGDIDVAADAAVLPFADQTLDFVVSAHALEHVPDVLETLGEWRRVLRTGGPVLLILPHAHRTYDRGRSLATYEHHRAERGRMVPAVADEHWAEWDAVLARSAPGTHHWTDSPMARRPDGSWNRSWIVANGYIHWHAWTATQMVDILEREGLRVEVVLDEMPDRADSFLVHARVDGRTS
jgi:SAM-dependent methyltransferase